MIVTHEQAIMFLKAVLFCFCRINLFKNLISQKSILISLFTSQKRVKWFLDALASLDLKLSVSEWLIFFGFASNSSNSSDSCDSSDSNDSSDSRLAHLWVDFRVIFHFSLLEKEWKHFFHFALLKKSESFSFSLFTSRTSKNPLSLVPDPR